MPWAKWILAGYFLVGCFSSLWELVNGKKIEIRSSHPRLSYGINFVCLTALLVIVLRYL